MVLTKMPIGGKKKKKGKKNPNPIKRKLRYRDSAEKYAQISSLYGDRRLEVNILNEGTRKAHIPGRFRKRVWMNKGDWVLVQPRDCDFREDSVVDVVYVYKADEVRRLERFGEIQIERSDDDGGEEDMFFEEIDEKEPPKRIKPEIEYPSSFTSSEEASFGALEDDDEEEEI